MTMNELKYDQQDSAKFELFATHRPCAKALSLICVFLFQYICENHFQRLAKRSMFTGLKAINHFGRPDMPAFLKFVQKKHSYVSCNNCSINSLIKKSWFFYQLIMNGYQVSHFTGQQSWCLQLRSGSAHQLCEFGMRGCQQATEAALLHPPLREFRLRGARPRRHGHCYSGGSVLNLRQTTQSASNTTTEKRMW